MPAGLSPCPYKHLKSVSRSGPLSVGLALHLQSHCPQWICGPMEKALCNVYTSFDEWVKSTSLSYTMQRYGETTAWNVCTFNLGMRPPFCMHHWKLPIHGPITCTCLPPVINAVVTSPSLVSSADCLMKKTELIMNYLWMAPLGRSFLAYFRADQS